jgi:hypothetical protein
MSKLPKIRLKTPEGYRLLQLEPDACPKCGYKIDAQTCLGRDKALPSSGDMSLCIGCGQFMQYGANLKLEILTDEEFFKLKPEAQTVLLAALAAWQSVKNPKQQHGWMAQIKKMSENCREWRKLNPGRDAKVQFNYPRNVMLATSISQAIKQRYVSADIAGLELIRSLWRQDDKTEPTVFMVRMAIEMSDTVAGGPMEGTE